MRKYLNKLTVEDRQIVWGWCRRMLVGYTAVAIVLLLAALAFRADHDRRDYGADESVAHFDHIGIDQLAISVAPAPQAIGPNVVVEQKAPLRGAGLDPRRVP